MPKKKQKESEADQSDRFRRTVRDMIDAGELDPIEAEGTLDRMVRMAAQKTKR